MLLLLVKTYRNYTEKNICHIITVSMEVKICEMLAVCVFFYPP